MSSRQPQTDIKIFVALDVITDYLNLDDLNTENDLFLNELAELKKCFITKLPCTAGGAAV